MSEEESNSPECTGFSIAIIFFSKQAPVTLDSTQKVRDVIGGALDVLGIEEEIDYTLEVSRTYGIPPKGKKVEQTAWSAFGDFLKPDEAKKVKTKKPCDPRCKNVTAKIFEAYKYYNKVNPGWGAIEGNLLKLFLASHLDWPEEKIFECIRNRFKSEINPAEEPRKWISSIGNYASGPLDQYGKPKSNGNGFHNGQQSHTNGSGATGHLLDHLPSIEQIQERRKADDERLRLRREARQ